MAFTYKVDDKGDVEFTLNSLRSDVMTGLEEYDGLKITLEPVDDEE